MRALAAAEERGARTDAELDEQRAAAADDAHVWARLDRVAPFVPRLEVAL